MRKDEIATNHINALAHKGWLTDVRAIKNGTICQAFFTNAADAAAYAVSKNGTNNCYVGINARFEPKGDARHVATVGQVVLDFDPVIPGTTLATLPASITTALAPWETQVVSSGHGLHVYIMFSPVQIMGDIHKVAEFQAGTRHFFNTLRQKLPSDIRLDSTYDVARVIRLLGTTNHKTGLVSSGILTRIETPFYADMVKAGHDKAQQTLPPLIKFIPTSKAPLPYWFSKSINDTVTPDQSKVEFALAIAALKAGWSDAQIEAMLLNRPASKASRHSNPQIYLTLTINAAKRRILGLQ